MLYVFAKIKRNTTKDTVLQKTNILNLLALLLNNVIADISEDFNKENKFTKIDFHEFISNPL